MPDGHHYAPRASGTCLKGARKSNVADHHSTASINNRGSPCTGLKM